MRIKQLITASRITAYGLAVAGLLSPLLAGGVVQAASNDTIYLSPSAGTYAVGSTVAVAVRENSNADQVNAIEADMTYSANLDFVSVDYTGSPFDVGPAASNSGGSLTLSRGSTSGQTGDKLVATVTFKLTAAGSSSVQVLGSSQMLEYGTGNNLLTGTSGATYTAATVTPAAPSPTPTPPPAATVQNGTKSSASPTVKVTTNSQSGSSSSPVTTKSTNGSTVELSGPTVVETTPQSDKPILKVEYYLNDKLVASTSSAPYRRSIDTTHVRNGKYTLTTKTYYADNTVNATNTAVIVKNPFGLTQVLLQLRHYAWLVAIVLLVLADVTWMWLRKRQRRSNTGGSGGPAAPTYTVYGGDSGGSFGAPGPQSSRIEFSGSNSGPANGNPVV